MEYKEIQLDNLDQEQIKELVGTNNQNIKILEGLFDCDIICRGNILKIQEEYFPLFKDVIDGVISSIKNNVNIDENHLKTIYQNLKKGIDISYKNKIAFVTYSGKPIKYKTYNQYKLSETIKDNDLIFAIGPAGTGKTYLAVTFACKAFKNGDVKKIILTRPAVEAGESLGFLPGDLKEKIDPYLMPLYDALEDILGIEQVEKLIEKGLIEVIPLAYMRGRTLNDAFIILDEAQNTTSSQMLMFLTRLGYNSKMVVNGDITQIDLNIKKNSSGLVIAKEKLQDINKISFVEFNSEDVVRNPLVQKIIERY